MAGWIATAKKFHGETFVTTLIVVLARDAFERGNGHDLSVLPDGLLMSCGRGQDVVRGEALPGKGRQDFSGDDINGIGLPIGIPSGQVLEGGFLGKGDSLGGNWGVGHFD